MHSFNQDPRPRNIRAAFPFIAAILIFLTFSNTSSAQSRIDKDNGVLGYRLGYPPDSMDNIVRRGRTQKLIRWEPESRELDLDGIPLKSVRLFFWDKKLHSIEIKTSSTDSDRLKEWLIDRYGEGEKEDAMGFRFSWTGAGIRIFFDQNIISHDALTTWVDDEVHEAYYRYMHHRKYGGQ